MEEKLVTPLLEPTKADVDFIGRFVWDVMRYTLRVCGLHRSIVVVNAKENAYSRPDFVKKVGVSVLRFCFSMREEWREALQKLPMSPFDEHYFAVHFSKIVKLADEEEEALQFNVEITLALCNEMALFFFYKVRWFNFLHIVGAASGVIIKLIQQSSNRFHLSLVPDAPRPNFQQQLEGLFHDVISIWELSCWFENFFREYRDFNAYKTRGPFYQAVEKQWRKTFKNSMLFGKKISDKLVKEYLGFLPKEVYDDIAYRTWAPMPSYSKVAWGRQPPSSLASSQREAADEKIQGRKDSEQTAQGNQGSKDSSKQTAQCDQGIKGSCKQTAQGDQGSKDSSKQTAQRNSKDSSKKSAQGDQGSKDSPKETTQGGYSSKISSKQITQGSHSSEAFSKLAAHGTRSDKGSKQTAEGGPNVEDFSVLGKEDDFSQFYLGTAGSSRASQGAIPKRRLQ